MTRSRARRRPAGRRLGPRPGTSSKARRPAGTWRSRSSSSLMRPVLRSSVIFAAICDPTPGMAVRACSSSVSTSRACSATARAAFCRRGCGRSPPAMAMSSASSPSAAATSSFSRSMWLLRSRCPDSSVPCRPLHRVPSVMVLRLSARGRGQRPFGTPLGHTTHLLADVLPGPTDQPRD